MVTVRRVRAEDIPRDASKTEARDGARDGIRDGYAPVSCLNSISTLFRPVVHHPSTARYRHRGLSEFCDEAHELR